MRSGITNSTAALFLAACFTAFLVTLFMALSVLFPASVSASPENCSPDSNRWTPTRYYSRGARVFHEGQWYEAREQHDGRRPGVGEFAWRAMDTAPECAENTTGKTPASNSVTSEVGTKKSGGGDESRSNKTGKTVQKTATRQPEDAAAKKDCRPSPAWTFSDSYRVGDRVVHEGDIYEAIRPTNGDMPGVAQPPHWKAASDGCANL